MPSALPMRASTYKVLGEAVSVSLIIYILRYFVNFAERISFYYQFAFIILLPNLVESIEDKNTKKFIRLAVVVLSCALFGYRCIRGGPNMYYYFFWQN